MKPQNNKDPLNNSFVNLHGEDWCAKQRIAGAALAEVMTVLTDLVKNQTDMTMLEIDALAESEILKRGCQATFKNFKGFPNAVCLSINKQLVHGIPTNAKFQNGDVITFDFGTTFEGAIADSATTVIWGEPRDKQHIAMIKCSQDCLYNSIRAMGIGKQIGVIGNAIYKTARNAGFGVVTKFGGHGISWNKPHADLFVANKATSDEGIRIQPGLTIAIEPLLVPGNCQPNNTKLDSDGWTISTDDISCHHEHSLYVHSDHIEIMSWRQDEAEFIPKQVYFN